MKDCGKIRETEDFLSTDTHKMEIAAEKGE
jgi:hypothetical protein